MWTDINKPKDQGAFTFLDRCTHSTYRFHYSLQNYIQRNVFHDERIY